MAQGGLRKWVAEKWVDIGAPKEGWQVSTLREIEGEQEEISKMCPYCKSTLHECFTKGECGQTKAPSVEHWP
jgi:hypothetical protein